MTLSFTVQLVGGQADCPRSGKSHTTQTPDNVQRISNLILAAKRVCSNSKGTSSSIV